MESEGEGIEFDLPPEYCHYDDDGCEFSSSCLNCPLPQCIYDEPRGHQRQIKRQRDKEIVRLFAKEGKGVKELAGQTSVSLEQRKRPEMR